MSKYEYAYYESERCLIAIADIREESKKDPHIYAQRYEGHLLCPECKQARLIVVQGADFPFFRAAPRSAHRDGCDFIRHEYVPTITDAQNPANAKTIRSQLRRALAKIIERQIACAARAGGNGVAHQPDDDGPLAQKLQRRKIAQRLIEMIPKSSEPHLPEVAVYYGRVKCVLDVVESHYNKEPFYHCDFQNIVTGEPLLTMNVSNGVWNHFTQEVKDLLGNPSAELRISFFGEAADFTRNGCHVVSLKNSEFLIVEGIY